MKTNLQLATVLFALAGASTVYADEPQFDRLIIGTGTEVTDVTALKADGVYLIFDDFNTTEQGDRRALRYPNGTTVRGTAMTDEGVEAWTITTTDNGVVSGINPNLYGWVFGQSTDAADNVFTVKNYVTGGYIPSATSNSGSCTTSSTASNQTFTYTDGFFYVVGENNIGWNGNDGDERTMALWGSSHPHRIFEPNWGYSFTYNGTLYDVTEESRREQIRTNYGLASQITDLLPNAQGIYEQLYLTSDKLITEANQISSANSDDSEGTNLGVLIDGSTNEIWHSDWHGTHDTDYHSLMYTFVNENNAVDFTFSYVGRSGNTSSRPSIIWVYGGKQDSDGQVTWSATYTVITSNDGLCQASGSVTFKMDDVYDALKFEVREIDNVSGKTGGSNVTHPTFNYSETQIYAKWIDPSLGDITDEMITALKDAITAANSASSNLLGETGDLQSAYDDLQAAYKAITDASPLLKQMLESEIAAAEAAFSTYFKDFTPGYESTTSDLAVAYQAAIDKAKAVVGDYEEATVTLRSEIAAATPTQSAVAITHGKVYKIKSAGGRGYLTYNPNSTFVWSSLCTKDETYTATDEQYEWMSYVDGNDAYLYSIPAKKFINSQGSGTYGKTWQFTSLPSAIEICPATDSTFGTSESSGYVYGNVVIREGSTYMSVSNSYNGPIITYFAVNDGGVPMQFELLRDATDEEMAEATAITTTLVATAKEEAETSLQIIETENSERDIVKDEVGYFTTASIDELRNAIAEVDADATLNSVQKATEINALYQAFYTNVDNRQQPKDGVVYKLCSVHADNVKYIANINNTATAIMGTAVEALEEPNCINWYCTVDETTGYFSLTNYAAVVQTSTDVEDDEESVTVPTVSNTVATSFVVYNSATNSSSVLQFKVDNAPNGTFNIWSPVTARYSVINEDATNTAFNWTTDLSKDANYTGRYKLTTVGTDIALATTRLSELTVDGDVKANTCFDLQGRRVDNPTTPGLYIINGKKTVIR